jgi:hypothetical protein
MGVHVNRRPITSYPGAHGQVRRLRGPASAQHCACGQSARDWAYTGDDPDERIDDAGLRFSLDPQRYAPMCRSCHRTADGPASKRLTDEQVAVIRKRHIPGRQAGHGVRTGNTRELAAEFGVTPQYVSDLARGRWRRQA